MACLRFKGFHAVWSAIIHDLVEKNTVIPDARSRFALGREMMGLTAPKWNHPPLSPRIAYGYLTIGRAFDWGIT